MRSRIFSYNGLLSYQGYSAPWTMHVMHKTDHVAFDLRQHVMGFIRRHLRQRVSVDFGRDSLSIVEDDIGLWTLEWDDEINMPIVSNRENRRYVNIGFQLEKFLQGVNGRRIFLNYREDDVLLQLQDDIIQDVPELEAHPISSMLSIPPATLPYCMGEGANDEPCMFLKKIKENIVCCKFDINHHRLMLEARIHDCRIGACRIIGENLGTESQQNSLKN